MSAAAETAQPSLDDTHLVTKLSEAALLMKPVVEAAGVAETPLFSPWSRMVHGTSPLVTNVERWYHGPRHPARMWQAYLDLFQPRALAEQSQDVARFCIFHDIVYGVGRPGEVEAYSANEYAVYCAGESDPPSPRRLARVYEAILRTADYAKHTPYIDHFVAVCLDLDLYELATDRYWVNSVLIRREMSAFSDDQFLAGRVAFLKSMLLRPQLFYLLPQDHEDAARRNLAAEHDALVAYGEKRLPWENWPHNLPDFVDRASVPDSV
jgi:predicted metal-dependent HD superfamily phosphohydrolase